MSNTGDFRCNVYDPNAGLIEQQGHGFCGSDYQQLHPQPAALNYQATSSILAGIDAEGALGQTVANCSTYIDRGDPFNNSADFFDTNTNNESFEELVQNQTPDYSLHVGVEFSLHHTSANYLPALVDGVASDPFTPDRLPHDTTLLNPSSPTMYSVSGSSNYYQQSDRGSLTTPSYGQHHSGARSSVEYAPSVVGSSSIMGDAISVYSAPIIPAQSSSYRNVGANRTHRSRTQTVKNANAKSRRQQHNNYRCVICQDSLKTPEGLSRHIKTHNTNRRSNFREQCAYCADVFEFPKDKRRHEATHEKPALQCQFPGCTARRFSRRDNLRRHIVNIHLVMKNPNRYLPGLNYLPPES